MQACRLVVTNFILKIGFKDKSSAGLLFLFRKIRLRSFTITSDGQETAKYSVSFSEFRKDCRAKLFSCDELLPYPNLTVIDTASL